MKDDNSYKEVWYVWDGTNKISKVTGVIEFGRYLEMTNGFLNNNNHWTSQAITHYTLGEKRRSVECRKCAVRYRYADIPIIDGCPECNKGKVWEYEK